MRVVYAYFTGCSLDTSAKEYDLSIRQVCRVLGIQLRAMEGWICCGALAAHATNRLLAISLSSRNLLIAATENLPSTTPAQLALLA